MQGAENKMTCLYSPADFELIKLPNQLQTISADVCKAFCVSSTDMKSDRQDRHTSIARWAFCWLCVKCTSKNYLQIAKFLKKDRTSVSHGFKRANEMRAADEHFFSVTECLKKQYLEIFG